MDLTETIAPKSDQMNADDLMSGPRTFTIAEVRKGNGEQPVDVILVEFPQGRPFKPSKSMRRVMVAAWGSEAAAYAGRRLTLYRDPSIRFGGQEVGGIRISHMSHIDKRLTLALTVTRGKRAPYAVEPLPESVPATATLSADVLADLTETLARKGIPEDTWLAGVNRITGGSATALEVITEDEARRVLGTLAQRPDVTEPAQAATPPAAEGSADDAATSSAVQQQEERRLSGVRRTPAAAPDPGPVEEPSSGEAAETSTGRDTGPRCTVTQQADINRHFGRLNVAEHAERVWWLNYLADLDDNTVDATKQLKKSEAVKIITALAQFTDRDALDASINQDQLLGDQ